MIEYCSKHNTSVFGWRCPQCDNESILLSQEAQARLRAERAVDEAWEKNNERA